jgi:hypothetical protein
MLLLLFLKFILILRQCLCVFHYDVTLLCCLGPSFLSDSLNFVIESLLLFKIADLVVVCLGLKVVSFLLSECLPLLTNLLHYLESTHFRVGIND